MLWTLLLENKDRYHMPTKWSDTIVNHQNMKTLILELCKQMLGYIKLSLSTRISFKRILSKLMLYFDLQYSNSLAYIGFYSYALLYIQYIDCVHSGKTALQWKALGQDIAFNSILFDQFILCLNVSLSRCQIIFRKQTTDQFHRFFNNFFVYCLKHRSAEHYWIHCFWHTRVLCCLLSQKR